MPKPKKQRPSKGSAPTSSDTISDPRFTNIQTDPRFRLPSKRNTHVKIDKRFAPMLEDEAFSSTAKVDRYGRKLPKDKGKRDLQKFYRVEDDDEDDEGGRIDDDEVARELAKVGGAIDDDGEVEGSEESEDSESSSEDDDDDDDPEDGEEDEVFGMLEEGGEGGQGIPKGEVSSRLAVVNLDWDNIRATDLMAVFQSFVPSSGGRILSIAIYPSEFGKERMEREEMEGPPKEIFTQSRKKHEAAEDDESDPEDDNDNDEDIKKSLLKEDSGAEFSSAHLRKYQLSRLRYYYAVLTCSSSSVASAIYDAVDGTEYLTTANFFDLRYIPDETSFEDDIPRDECSRLPDGYRPNEFVTDALQHSKVKLTWDADDTVRKESQKRAFGGSRKDMNDNDLKAYLGSDSEDDAGEDQSVPVLVDATVETADENAAAAAAATAEPVKKLSKKEAERQRMRALLGLSAEPASRKSKTEKGAAPVGDMQVTFTSGLSSSSDPSKKKSVFENEPEREETTVEKYVRKEKERKARRKEKMKSKGTAAGAGGDEEDDHDNDNGEVETGTMMAEGLATAEREEADDAGFEDPFFTSASNGPDLATKTSKSKADRRAKREAREAEEAASALERTKLEAIMADPDGNADDEVKHFDINALARAEKVAGKGKKRKQKLSARDKEALEAREKDDFSMDVEDERFRDLYERAEFAIDPSHPRYKATEGMRSLLEEGRRKRGNDDAVDGEMTKKSKRSRDDAEDVADLVRKVKKKSKMAA